MLMQPELVVYDLMIFDGLYCYTNVYSELLQTSLLLEHVCAVFASKFLTCTEMVDEVGQYNDK